jgi:hypothetical protein
MTDTVSSLEELTSTKNDIEAINVSTASVIPVGMMSGLGKLLKIVNSSEESPKFVMRESDAEVRLNKPVFVTDILLEVGSLDSVRGMKLVAADVLTNKTEKIAITVERTSGCSVRFVLNRVITSFVLKRESFYSKDIKKIVVRGMLLNELEKFEKEFKDLGEYKDELLALIDETETEFGAREQTLRDDRKSFEASKQASETELEELQKQVESLTANVAELNKSLALVVLDVEARKTQRAQLTARNDELEKRNLATESELSQKLQTLSSTNVEISDKEQKLKALVSNVNVFTEEFSGFVDQGTRQVRLYTLFALVPFALLVTVVVNLFNGAVDLSTRFQSMARIDLVTLVVTRLPFVTVAGLIVGVSVKVLFFLINRIIAIHQQRLDLAKIAIIAKDVSDASAAGLGMPLEERYEAKTYLKMSILRAYLSEQIAKFSYKQRESELGVEIENNDHAALRVRGVIDSVEVPPQ